MSTQIDPRTTTAAPDPERIERFLQRLAGDIGTALHGGALWIGDQLGLFDAMAGAGPVTSDELAVQTDLDERYLREWLDGMAAAEYVEYDPATRRYDLPPEHAAPLTDDGFPFYLGGLIEFIVPWVSIAPKVAEAFRHGGGVPQAEYPSQTWEAIERANAPYQQQRLVDWLQQTPHVMQRLSGGGSLVDVGCGSGQAAIVLAEAFPAARITGWDIHPESIERARRNAANAGVEDRVHFEVRDGVELPADTFDVVTTFDVVHDTVDPSGLLRSIRRALTPDGTYVAVEMNAASDVEENIGPVGRLLYSMSLLYCMTTSLARDGAGLGTAMGDQRFRELAAEAGFVDVGAIPIDNPFLALYQLEA